MTQPLLQTIGLSKSFGQFPAVNSLDFSIYSGELVILTGPNGSGKSTLLHCLSGLIRATKGNILVDGHDLYRDEVLAKQRLAFVADVPRFYRELTTWEHLWFISLAFSVEQNWEERAEFLLRDFGLWDSRVLYPHNLSRGMRLKLGICLALIRPFKVLLMDEPTSAMDAGSVDLFLEKLKILRDEGKAILMTSHNLSLVGQLGGKAWQMKQGRITIG